MYYVVRTSTTHHSLVCTVEEWYNSGMYSCYYDIMLRQEDTITRMITIYYRTYTLLIEEDYMLYES